VAHCQEQWWLIEGAVVAHLGVVVAHSRSSGGSLKEVW
jgi:hypothetical protein